MSYVQVKGLAQLSARVADWPAAVDAAVREQVLTEVAPMPARMAARAAAVGGSSVIAGRNVSMVTTGTGATVRAAPTPTLKGGEFGARGQRRTGYVTRSRKGTAYTVSRRTTRQFRPYLGNRGYWFWPVVRADLKGIRGRVAAAVREAVG
jgi:hypothetical protein